MLLALHKKHVLKIPNNNYSFAGYRLKHQTKIKTIACEYGRKYHTNRCGSTREDNVSTVYSCSGSLTITAPYEWGGKSPLSHVEVREFKGFSPAARDVTSPPKRGYIVNINLCNVDFVKYS